MRNQTYFSRPTYIVLASSSVILLTWRLLQWRARKRALHTVERVRKIVRPGHPLIDYENPEVRERILAVAIRRASKWISLREAKHFTGQVGGIRVHKKPLLSVEPDYVLKPLLSDHRGMREVAFYEAIRTAAQVPTSQAYARFLAGPDPPPSALWGGVGDLVDIVAVALSILLHDPVVTGSEEALMEAWREVRREVEALSRLANLTAPYYGVVGQLGVSYAVNDPLGLTDDAYLMLHDLTSGFSKPCVMDLKIGTKCYEPDATPEKITRETAKYPLQAELGLRIVGMRVYDPADSRADPATGYVYYPKSYGRSVAGRQDLLEAFRTFFHAGRQQSPTAASLAVANGSSSGSSPSSKKASALAAQEGNIPVKLISNLLFELRPLKRWFEENVSLRFYASSLLIVCEGAIHNTTAATGANPSGTTDTAAPPSNMHDRGRVVVKMIDFGHVRRRPEGEEDCPDEGYRTGLKTLLQLLADLFNEEQQAIRPGSSSC